MACYGNVIYGPSADAVVVDTLLNAVLPTTGHPKLSIQPVYGDDGVQVAYYEYVLTVDTIIYVSNTVLLDVEDEAARIRNILQTPGLKLVLSPVGLGTMPVINGTIGAANKPDIKGGPYPQETMVEGFVTNNAIVIKWSVMFRINHCSDNVVDLVQFNSEIDLDVDDEGDVTFNLRVTYQRRIPFSDISTLTPLVNALVRNAGMSFQGMKKRKRTSFSRDMRLVQIHIEYKDIPSDSALFPSTKAIEATDEISSELFSNNVLSGAGFATWARKFSVNITLPARVHKSYGYIVFRKILNQRFRNLSQLGRTAAVFDTTPTAGTPTASTTKNSFLLIRLRISNPIYSRTIRFEADYVVITDLTTLLSKTQICARVNSSFTDDPDIDNPTSISDQWKLWDDSDSITINGNMEYEGTGIPISYSHCTALSGHPQFGATKLLPLENDPDVDADPDEETEELPKQHASAYNWIDYENDVGVIEKTNNIHVNYLQPAPSVNYYKSDEASASVTANRTVVGYTLNGKTVSPAGSSQQPKTVNRGISTFQVRMRGYALRVNDKIPMPVITHVAGHNVSRTEKLVSFQKQIARGDVPVYLAAWDFIYTVDGDIHSGDILSSIKSSGTPGHYS